MKSSTALLGFAATLLLGTAAIAAPPSQWVTAPVMTGLPQHPDLGPTIKTHAKAGVFYGSATGTISLQKQSAQELASGVADVKRVINSAGLDRSGG